MTGKERAAFRAQANGLETILQIGKGGLTETVVSQIDEMLTAKELIKIKLLESAPVAVRECADEIAAQTGADVIQVIGSKIVLYRYSQELHEKQQQKAKTAKLIKQAERLKLIKAKKAAAQQKYRAWSGREQNTKDKNGNSNGRKQYNTGKPTGMGRQSSRSQKENRNLWR